MPHSIETLLVGADVYGGAACRVGFGQRAVGDFERPVVVDAEEVQRLADDLQVAVAPVRAVRELSPHVGFVRGVAAGEQRVEPDPVVQGFRAVGSRAVGRTVGGGQDPVGVEGDADLARIGSAQFLHCQAVGEEQVVRGGERRRAFPGPGGVPAHGIAQESAAERLVERDPVADPVAETGNDRPGVGGEVLRGAAGTPAAGILQGLRQVPVVEGGHRGDPRFEQRIDETVVEVQAALVDVA